ncbi:hypothetical protein CDAR_574291 [Caerostris darwini]|uniref:LAGLIDADG homing endonuclease n=1 Tax=Caerostris darwini TaxID=1538125 RepID=A0AAV4R308_9ARAC|nr:hypothetical protein CDAR_574291 [Caerostris darwini]
MKNHGGTFFNEIMIYFEEWIKGLDIKDFEGLKKPNHQLKKRVPFEVTGRLLEEWAKFTSPIKLVDRLYECNCVRSTTKKSFSAFPKGRVIERVRHRIHL